MKSVNNCLIEARQKLQAGGNSADAEILLAYVSGRTRTSLYAWPELLLSEDVVREFDSLIMRRQRGEPVAYLVGTQEFWSLSFRVDASVLVPRPDTEILVQQVLAELHGIDQPRVLELGTGSGAIVIALATERADAQLTASDFSKAALQVAQDNADRLTAGGIRFIHSNWFENINVPTGGFDVIVSNPPYIAITDPHLHGDGVAHEPSEALKSGSQGLNAIGKIISQAPAYLNQDGALLLEHGWDQRDAVTRLLVANGYTGCTTIKDHAGNDRVTTGYRTFSR